MSTQKTIRLYETFESYDEFKTTLDAYCQLTHQSFTAVDSKKLKPKDSSQASEDLVKKFVQRTHLLKTFKESKDEKLEKLLDELKQNPQNTIETKTSADGILESCFIILDFQKDWLTLYPEILHLDGTYKTQDERYILFTFLVQVREKKK
jgi:hypothetical protein